MKATHLRVAFVILIDTFSFIKYAHKNAPGKSGTAPYSAGSKHPAE